MVNNLGILAISKIENRISLLESRQPMKDNGRIVKKLKRILRKLNNNNNNNN